MSDSKETATLRIIAALILGAVVGVIGFFVIALILGFIEDLSGLKTGITFNLAENIWSAVMMFILIIAGMAFLYWKVKTTPPSKEEIVE